MSDKGDHFTIIVRREKPGDANRSRQPQPLERWFFPTLIVLGLIVSACSTVR